MTRFRTATLFVALAMSMNGAFAQTAPAEEWRPKRSTYFKQTPFNPKAPTWERLLSMGDAAHMKHNDAIAKRYWIGALTELEKAKEGDKLLFPKLEKRLIDAYPDDWSKQKMSPEQRVKAEQEQVDVYARLVKITKAYKLKSGSKAEQGFANMAETAMDRANADLEKVKAAVPDTNKK